MSTKKNDGPPEKVFTESEVKALWEKIRDKCFERISSVLREDMCHRAEIDAVFRDAGIPEPEPKF